MLFEEVLPMMREGKKARVKSHCDGSHWICGTLSFAGENDNNIKTIHRIEREGNNLPDKYSWGIPRWLIMAEDWEVLED